MNNVNVSKGANAHLLGFLYASYCVLLICLIFIPLPHVIIDLLLSVLFFLSIFFFVKSVAAPVSSLLVIPQMLVFISLFRNALAVAVSKSIIPFDLNANTTGGAFINSISYSIFEGIVLQGIFLFVIITFIATFLVTKGGSRIAEVAARFSLESLPGLQIAIESQLKSGQISGVEANIKRNELNQISQFYGSMDGTVRYLQGDIIIAVFVTIFSSVIGVISIIWNGSGVEGGIEKLLLASLSIGTFLLINSIFTSLGGILAVSRKVDVQGDAWQISNWINDNTREILIIALIFIVFSMLPWLPFLPLFLIGIFLPLLLIVSKRGFSYTKSYLPFIKKQTKALNYTDRKNVSNDVGGVVIGIQIAGDLTLTLQGNSDARYLQEFWEIERNKSYMENGFYLPNITISGNQDIPNGHIHMLIQNRIVETYCARPNCYFVTGNKTFLDLLHIKIEDQQVNPFNGSSSYWVSFSENIKASLQSLNIPCLSFLGFLSVLVKTVSITCIEDIFGIGELKNLIENEKQTNRELITEFYSNSVISNTEFVELMRRLVKEQISIKNFRKIIENILNYQIYDSQQVTREEWLDGLYKTLRISLAKESFVKFAREKKVITGFSLSTEVEDSFLETMDIQQSSNNFITLDSGLNNKLTLHLQELFYPLFANGQCPIVIFCRQEVRNLIQHYLFHKFNYPGAVVVLSYQELQNYFRPEILGEIKIKQ